MNKDFTLVNCDTDSISFNKKDGAIFTEDEQAVLIDELNSIFPDSIKWEHDGIYHTVIVFKAKNYALWDGKKLKLKGSSIKDQKKEPALLEFLQKSIWDLINSNGDNLVDIYHKYIKESLNPIDIKRWAQKKTLTKPILVCENDDLARTNEKVLWRAIKDKGLSEGDKFYIYPAIFSETETITTLKNGKIKVKIVKDTGVKSIDDWTQDHDSEKLVSRVFSTLEILSNVIDMNRFIDYSLVKNKHLLKDLLNKIAN